MTTKQTAEITTTDQLADYLRTAGPAYRDSIAPLRSAPTTHDAVTEMIHVLRIANLFRDFTTGSIVENLMDRLEGVGIED